MTNPKGVTVLLTTGTATNYPNGETWRTEDTGHGLVLKVSNPRGDVIATHAPGLWVSASRTSNTQEG